MPDTEAPLLIAAVGETLNDDDMLGVVEPESLPVGVGEGVCAAVPELLAVGDGVGVPLRLGTLAVDDGVRAGVPLAVIEPEGETLGDAPGEGVRDGVAVNVDDALTVLEPLSLPVGVPEGVVMGVPAPLRVGLGVRGGVPLADVVVDGVPESEPVDEGDAPSVTDDVGVRDCDRERLDVDEGVPVGDEVLLAVTLGVGVPESDTDEVSLVVVLCVGVADADAPGETDVVGVADCVA